jgi:hypothetical protein
VAEEEPFISAITAVNNEENEPFSDASNNVVDVKETVDQVQEFVSSNITDHASVHVATDAVEVTATVDSMVVFRSTTTTTADAKQKRVSLDEELMYQLEQVDRKVKYMNETCSENESDEDDSDDDDRYYDQDLNYNRNRVNSNSGKGSNNDAGAQDFEDLDDENFDYDESVELDSSSANNNNNNNNNVNGNSGAAAAVDGVVLKNPRTPAKIKSDIRQNRAVDLHEEIKQISNVIQDLVQTINVRNGSTTTSTAGGCSVTAPIATGSLTVQNGKNGHDNNNGSSLENGKLKQMFFFYFVIICS